MNSKASTKASAYCAVCHSAGKSKAEYTSHYVRASTEPGAKTTCPYLLTITCGYCKGQGHTPKHCPVSKQNEKKKHYWQQQEPQLLAVATKPKPTTTNKSRNTFETLAILMEDEERIAEQLAFEQQKFVEHQKAFPAMAAAAKTPNPNTRGALTGWAKIAATAAKPAATAAKPAPTVAKPALTAAKPAATAAKPAATAAKPAPTTNQRDFTPEELFDESNAEVAEYNRHILYKSLEAEDKSLEHISWADIVD